MRGHRLRLTALPHPAGTELRRASAASAVGFVPTAPIPALFLLQSFDDFIFAFFAVEMIVKMIALGIFGKKCYLGDTWNRLDFFIVIAG